MRVAFLVSGAGTTLEGVAERIAAERWPIEIVLVLSDRPGVAALDRARRLGLPTSVVARSGAEPTRWASEVDRELRTRSTGLVVLAGFLSVLPPEFLRLWSGRVVNLHPSLLPRHGGPGMYGPRVHRAVLESGDAETGASVHVVTDQVDAGPVVAQVRLAVAPAATPESLRARLHPHEVMLLSETLRRFADGTLPLPFGAGPSRTEPPLS